MDEIEIIDSTQINNQTSFFSKLKFKLQQGYKVNVIFKKVFNFGQNPNNDQSKKQSTHYQQQVSSPPQSFNTSIRPGPKIKIVRPQQIEPDQRQGIKYYHNERKEKVELTFNKNINSRGIRRRKQQQVVLSIRISQFCGLLENLKKQCKGPDLHFDILYKEYDKIYDEANNLLKNYSQDLDMILKKRLWVIIIESKVQSSFCLKRLHKFIDAALCIQYVVKRFNINDPEIFTKLLLEEAGLYYQSFNFVKALDIYQHCLVLYEKLNWKPQMAYVLCQMGVIFAYFNKFDEAKRLVCEGIEIGKKNMALDDYKFALCYDSLGIVFFQSKDYLLSLESFSNSMSIKEKNIHHLLSKAKTHNFMGQAYLITCVYTKAIEEFKEAINLLEKLNEQHYQTKAMVNLGIAYYYLGDYSDSFKIFQQAYKKQQEIFEKGHTTLRRTQKNLNFIQGNKPTLFINSNQELVNQQ